MRLINVKTGQLEEHNEPPPYAILSHRWESEEVTIGQYTSSTACDTEGFRKIRAFIQEVQNDSNYCQAVTHVWVDTCCIDKTSSAELSEAINSMYRWYENAVVCYAYLSDVETLDELEKSAWFTRGWTLQELLAPTYIRFYNKHWKTLGEKRHLLHILSRATGIGREVLSEECSVFECSVAQRMSWAAKRRTTRIEDRAYSLMGLFEINMPMLYGEGEKAFQRLQQEIIRESDDQSIFAWTIRSTTAIDGAGVDEVKHQTPFGMIARSIDQFEDCRGIMVSHSMIRQSPYALTNSGLSIQLLLLPWTMHVYIGVLNCAEPVTFMTKRYCIFLRRVFGEEQFARVAVQGRDRVLLDGSDLDRLLRSVSKVPRDGLKILVRQRHSALQLRSWHYGFRLEPFRNFQLEDIPSENVTIYRRVDTTASDPALLVLPEGGTGTVATIVAHDLLPYNRVVYIRLGFDFNFLPVVLVTLETKLDLDKSGFVRPQDPQFRVEKGCYPHNWLKETVQNDGKYFAGSANLLAVTYPDRPSYYHQDSEHVRVELTEVLDVDGPSHWSLSIYLNLESLRPLTGRKMRALAKQFWYHS